MERNYPSLHSVLQAFYVIYNRMKTQAQRKSNKHFLKLPLKISWF